MIQGLFQERCVHIYHVLIYKLICFVTNRVDWYDRIQNLVTILGTDCSIEKVDHMIASVEANDKGDISFQSFLKAFQRETSKNERMLSKEDDDDKESD